MDNLHSKQLARCARTGYLDPVTQADAIRRLKANEAEIRRMGIEHLSLFGSTARGDQRPESDIDIAARFRPDFALGAFEFVGIEQQIAGLLGKKVDLVMEPSSAHRLQAQIDRDRVDVF